MAPSVVKHRFQNSLDMVAARSMRPFEYAAQSATGNTWCIMDSPTLGDMSAASRGSPVDSNQTGKPRASSSRLVSERSFRSRLLLINAALGCASRQCRAAKHQEDSSERAGKRRTSSSPPVAFAACPNSVDLFTAVDELHVYSRVGFGP